MRCMHGGSRKIKKCPVTDSLLANELESTNTIFFGFRAISRAHGSPKSFLKNRSALWYRKIKLYLDFKAKKWKNHKKTVKKMLFF